MKHGRFRWDQLLASLPAPWQVEASVYAQEIRRLIAAVGDASASDTPELSGAAALHPSPWVRNAILSSLAARHPDDADVREAIRWAVHDYDDFVAFRAIRLAGKFRVTDALPDLLVIVGRASERLTWLAGKPVGIGHAIVLDAITKIAGTTDVKALRQIEDRLFPGGQLSPEPTPTPSSALRASILRAAPQGEHHHDLMVQIPEGVVHFGIPECWRRRTLNFDWSSAPGAQVVQCSNFRMDCSPVSVREYDGFAFSDAAISHVFCHAEEPPNKLHIRNTYLDTRSGPDHPVSGVDWFDAYAFAESQGKRLPTEAEWQRAAQGDDRRAYPWGDDFASERTHCQPEPHSDAIRVWRRALLAQPPDVMPSTTVPNGMDGNVSPFGTRDMAGNVWEWTATSFATGQQLDPIVREGDDIADALSIIYRPTSYGVIKGGAWTSLPEQLSCAFRGRDLIMDRHFEIGFRCVCACP